MPETTPEKSIADAWPGAYQAAVAKLHGLGPNEPVKSRLAIRVRTASAAALRFSEAGVPFARVAATITWGRDRPTVTLELITMDGQRYEGGAAIDPRMSPTMADLTAPTGPSSVIAASGARDFVASLSVPVDNEASFFADVLAEDDARLARQPSETE